ncbi:CHAT domain-containing protein [Synechococcus sp. CS-1328]|uniref:CHAT domain-containing protein n=1 Tax=Synechococcus sp. CS-1328 TaxID=2847976 RepID=UPI00223C4569|nr:CHAT domain-containing protein [Synechococcus sp. CS-1328]MCT0224003.1 CHAT domain-containing protein [Synechococcus sp. CS-1328]
MLSKPSCERPLSDRSPAGLDPWISSIPIGVAMVGCWGFRPWRTGRVSIKKPRARYYRLLKAGKGRQEALVQVQEEFRSTPKHKEWKDYKYWAAWQLSGARSPIQGL